MFERGEPPITKLRLRLITELPFPESIRLSVDSDPKVLAPLIVYNRSRQAFERQKGVFAKPLDTKDVINTTTIFRVGNMGIFQCIRLLRDTLKVILPVIFGDKLSIFLRVCLDVEIPHHQHSSLRPIPSWEVFEN